MEYEGWPTIAEAAQSTGISTRSLERYVSQGKIRREFKPQEGKKPIAVLNPGDLQKVVEKKAAEKVKLLPRDKVPAAKAPDRQSDVAGMLAALFSRSLLDLDRKVYLSEKEATRFLGLPRTYVQQQRKALHAVNISKRWFYRRADLERHSATPSQ